MQLLCFYTRYSYMKTIDFVQPLARVFMMRATMSLELLVLALCSFRGSSQTYP
jgi:hypothetical protein